MKFKVEPYCTTISQCPAIYDEKNKLVAQVTYGLDYDTAEKAARLLAAAPELLEALEAIVGHRNGRCPHLTTARASEIYKIAASVIAKAKGE